jgi:hypothetical protein
MNESALPMKNMSIKRSYSISGKKRTPKKTKFIHKNVANTTNEPKANDEPNANIEPNDNNEPNGNNLQSAQDEPEEQFVHHEDASSADELEQPGTKIVD